MKIRFFQSSSLAIAAAIIAASGFASAQAFAADLQLTGANATLVQDINSKNASQGEAVSAKLTSTVKGATELPKGTVLLGKVDQVQTSTNGGPATLSIVFDQAQLRDGRTIPVKATLIGAFPSEAGNYGAYDDGDSAEGVLPGSIAPDQKVDQEPGVLGGHVALHSAVQSNTSGVFTSNDRNVNLKRGTQLQLAIAAEPAAQMAGN
jgi:hypothetical protein